MDDEVDDLLYKTIKRHAGLSEWDRDGIEAEVAAIRRALKRKGYVVVKKGLS